MQNGEISEMLGSIANGDLTRSVQQEYVGDFGSIRRSLEGISANLNSTMSQIRESAVQSYLPEQMREVLYIKMSSELTFREIGEILGKSENWARVTYFRGKEKIMKGLMKNE